MLQKRLVLKNVVGNSAELNKNTIEEKLRECMKLYESICQCLVITELRYVNIAKLFDLLRYIFALVG